MSQTTFRESTGLLKNYLSNSFLSRLVLIMALFGTMLLNAQTYSTIGSGTSTNGASGYPTPFGNYYWGNKEQYFVTADELLASGVDANEFIFSIGFNVINKNSVPALNSYTLKIYSTTSSDPLASGWVTTNQVATATFPSLAISLGWNNLALDSPFVWNGTDNLVIEVCFVNDQYTLSGNASVQNTNDLTGTSKKMKGFRDDDDPFLCSSDDQSSISSTTRPNIRFGSYLVPPTCIIPTALNAGAITTSSALLSWSSTNQTFDIEYGLPGFIPGTGTVVSGVSNNYLLSNLESFTTYNYIVRSNCGAEGLSSWSDPFVFTTQKLLPSPWFEGFASGTSPDITNLIPGAPFSLSNDLTALLPAVDYFLYRNLFQANSVGSGLVSVNIGPILPGDKLSFNYRMAMYSSPYGPVDSSAGDIDVFISTDFGANYTLLGNIPYNEVGGWQSYEALLSAFEGQVVKIKLVVNYNYLPNDYIDHYLGFDNFYIGSCALPSIPQVSNENVNSITLNIDGLASDTYEIEYGALGFTQGTGTILVVNGGANTINELSSATEYEYYIRKVCGLTNSSWLGKFKFTTTCNVFTEGFVENFDTTTVGSTTNPTVPLCWSFIDGGSGYGYVTNYDSSSLPNCYYIYNSDDQINPYILVSPETENFGDGLYRVTFKAKSGWSESKLKFGTMVSQNDADTFVELQEFNLTTTYQDFVAYFPIGTADYFAFKHGQSATYQSIYIDNVVYEPIPNCVEPTGISVDSNFPQSTALVSWISPEVLPAHNFEIEWGVTGFTPGEGTIVQVTGTSYLIENLQEATNYSVYVRRVCTSENTAWVGPVKFLHDYCYSGPTSVDNGGVTEIVLNNEELEFTPLTSAPYYLNLIDQSFAINAGQPIDFSIKFETGYTYDTHIWIDLNKDGVFDNTTEKVYTGVSTNQNPTTLSGSFIVPNLGNYETGDYRMRIGTADSGQSSPNPCYSGSYGETIDATLNITFPCLTPTNISFTDVGFDYVVIDWDGQGNTNFILEYGPAGFTQGQGAIIENVTKPYTLEGLTSGGTYDFYVRKQCVNVYGDWSSVATTYIYCNTLEPTGASNQTLVEDELLSDLVINGQNIKFYSDPNLTIELPASTAVVSNGTYFVTQTIGCESDSFLIVTVTVLPRIAKPVVNVNQVFCDGGSLGDIEVSSLPGATVIWYQTLTSTEALPLSTELSSGTYYVVQTDGITTSHRVLVQVAVNPIPQNLVPQSVHLCGAYTFSNVAINSLPGAQVKWYTSMTATVPISGNELVETGTYYVTQSFGTCESQRVPFEVVQFEALATPIAGIQTFCGSGTVTDLVATGATGAQILWYASSISIDALAPSTTLSNGTYYVAQTLNGCFSERKAVAVRVVSLAAPQVNSFTICGGGTIADLYIPGATDVTYKWYLSPSSSNELTQNTALVQGTYFVERVQFGCASTRAAVQVNIGSIPNSPTGPATQSYVEGSTIANLMIDQPNVVWYSTYNDSQNGINPLPSYMPLVNGSTYYAVIIGTNGCPSLPFLVKVNVYLSNDEFVRDELKYFPNPVNDILNITYSDRILQVDVFDILGKRVKTVNTNAMNIEVNLSDLSSGTYMVQLRTENKQQFIKVVKK